MKGHRTAIVVALLVLGLTLSACGRRTAVEYVPDGGSLAMSQVESLAKNADLSRVAGVDVSQAPDVRTDTLVWLRGNGTMGQRAASLLTEGFPDRTEAVPVLVEIATVEGVRTLIVVEAFGGETGPLTYRRLWVFDLKTGQIIRSAAYR